MKCLPLAALLFAAATPLAAQSATDPANEAKSHARMIKTLREIAERHKIDHHYHGTGEAEKLWAQLEAAGDKAPWRLRFDSALAHMRLGNTREGIRVLEQADKALREKSIEGGLDAANSVRFYLAMGWLRVAESENCCARPTPDSCILPLRGRALHTEKEGSTNAIPYLLDVIANTPENDDWQLRARWLLNLAHMTLGTYPDGVDKKHLIPPSAFASKIDFPKFPNIAQRVGLDTFGMLGGLIVDDFDDDGDLDILSSNWGTASPLLFWRNEGNGTFTERSKEAGLEGITGGINMFQADYDNDGDVDVYVLRGAWLYDHGRDPNSLLRNRGDGTFVDVTFAAGLGEVHYPSSTCQWADIDNDGDLDLYVGNETSPEIRAPNQLFRNDGDGTFYDIAERAGVQNLGYTKGLAFGDYDEDGKVDLFVSNLKNGANKLYHNLGNCRFEDVAPRLGLAKPPESFGTWFWDYDNDGHLDLFVAAYCTSIGDLAAWYLGLPRPHPETMRLYRGDGQGHFTDVTAAVGLTYPALPMGANFGDLDNDGFLDFYLGTGDPYYYSLMPNLMFKNMGGAKFEDVTVAGGFGHLQKGHGIAFADLDADGDLDVFSRQGGAYPGDAAHDVLFENPGFGNHWLAVHLVGTESNRSAIGARLRAVIVEDGVERCVYRHVNSGGCFGANPLRQHLGLGKATAVKSLEVLWPRAGKVQTLADLPADRLIRIVEGKDGYTTVPQKSTVLGGK